MNEHKSVIAETQQQFDLQVKAGICVICNHPAEPGTRLCGGDRGCLNGPVEGH